MDLITILRFLTRKKIWQTFEFDTDQLLIFCRTTFAKINGLIRFPSIKVLRFFRWGTFDILRLLGIFRGQPLCSLFFKASSSHVLLIIVFEATAARHPNEDIR